MKREICFRAWHPEFGQMVYSGSEYVYEKREFTPFVFEVGFSHYPQEEWEIMQWTGLKDCKGNDIYEGDILNVTFPNGGKVRAKMEFDRYRWAYLELFPLDDSINSKAMASSPYPCFSANYGSDRLEVIGNIWENHNLIQQ